jgi:predicted ATPase
LSEIEQALFSHVVVFRGGWTLDAAKQVAGATLGALTALVDKSLVRQDSAKQYSSAEGALSKPASEPRFVMLELIREYALEQLAARAEAETLGRAHASYYLALAEAAAAQWDGPTADRAIAQLTCEHDNLRAALHSARDGDLTLGMKLGAALWRFWRRRGYLSEGRVWLSELLALSENAPDAIALSARLRALEGAAWLASYQHDFAHAARLFEQSMALRRTLGESETNLLSNAGIQACAAGQY